VIQVYSGEQAADSFGQTIAWLPDIDGDAYGDVLIGASQNSSAAYLGGKIYVRSGTTGANLYTDVGAGMGEFLGYSVASLGDVDGDGMGDFGATGAGGNGGDTQLYSGASGVMIHEIPDYGSSIAECSDLDGDSYPEVLVGDSAVNNIQGEVRVLRGGDLHTALHSSTARIARIRRAVVRVLRSCDRRCGRRRSCGHHRGGAGGLPWHV
jgi:hypothetical protein